MAKKTDIPTGFRYSEFDDLYNDAATGTGLVLHAGPHISLVIGCDALQVSNTKSTTSCDIRQCGFRSSESPKILNIPLYNILWAELVQDQLVIDYALPSKKNVVPATLKYSIDSKTTGVESWIHELLERSYRGASQKKRAKVLVNPHGGRGKARKWYSNYVEPLFRAARCSIDTIETRHSGEGVAIAETMKIEGFDIVVICSGDGLAHEVFNGLGKRPDGKKALSKIAVAHIPCGSGNGLSHNINETGIASVAALAIIKGVRKPLDLITITQGDTRTLSFLSQVTGMGAESDLATENLRWMGPLRFELGFATRIMQKKVYPAQIAVKFAIESKSSILEHHEKELSKISSKESQMSSQFSSEDSHSIESDETSSGLPPLRYGTIKSKTPDDWVQISCDNLGMLYCGNLAFMGPSAKIFPAALPNDGLMDLILIDGNISRRASFKLFSGVKDETFFHLPTVRYHKINAYRWMPKNQDSGYISVDGESIPFEPYQAEIHKGLGTVIVKNDQFK